MKKINIIMLFVISALVIYFIISTDKFQYNYNEIKIAFIGDQGLNENSKAVLELIKNEKTDVVLHQGDFDYENNPSKWDEQINNVLGYDFPYFASIGNHDEGAWLGYQNNLLQRLKRIEDADCSGDYGVMTSCKYKNIHFLLLAPGIKNLDYENYTENSFSDSNAIWRICSWHKNNMLMQVGHKFNEVDLSLYDKCRDNGAIIATAHEHSYSRSYLIENFEKQNTASKEKILVIDKGKSFVFVSGLGGRSIRSQDDKLASNGWWASVYTSNQNATYGALFCIFNFKNIKNKAYCYFKDIKGNIPDEFYLINNIKN